jgi:hypothetical protein
MNGFIAELEAAQRRLKHLKDHPELSDDYRYTSFLALRKRVKALREILTKDNPTAAEAIKNALTAARNEYEQVLLTAFALETALKAGESA